MKTHKCKTDGCKRKIDVPFVYCSIECACYDGAFSCRGVIATKNVINK